MSDQAKNVEGKVGELFEAQPLVVGIIGMALGALAGALAPNTRRENELLSAAGTALRGKVGGVAEEAVNAVERATSHVASTVKSLANEEGLTATSLRDGANNLAQKAGRMVDGAIDAIKSDAQQAIRGNKHS